MIPTVFKRLRPSAESIVNKVSTSSQIRSKQLTSLTGLREKKILKTEKEREKTEIGFNQTTAGLRVLFKHIY